MTPTTTSFRREQFRTFHYLAAFVREWTELKLTDEDLRELEQIVLADPDRGDLMAGTGGLRKLRFSPTRWNRGKSGALRIGYCHSDALEKVWMIAVFAKSDKANLTPSERREIKRFLEKLWKSASK